MPKKYGRRANFVDVDTGEMFSAKRGTKQYEKYKSKGYLTREQISHRKEYQPDIIEPPEEEYTDYPEADDKEMLKQKIEDMYNSITQELDKIPDEKYVKGRIWIDLRDSKQMLFNLVDDLYAKAESDDDANSYLIFIMPVICSLVEAVRHASTQEDVETHISQLASALSGGAIDLSLAKALGNLGDYQGNDYLGWYQYTNGRDERLQY